MKDLRAELTPAEKRMVRDSLQHIERILIRAIPEMMAGVKATGSQSSMSPTIALTPKGKKKRDIKLKVTARVRAEREAFEDDYHLDDDGQLALGMFEDDFEDEDDDEPSSTRASGFDRSSSPALSDGFGDDDGDQLPATH